MANTPEQQILPRKYSTGSPGIYADSKEDYYYYYYYDIKDICFRCVQKILKSGY
jgi:hypothetical protein